MKALDTNVLARFFIDDPDDAQAAKQRPVAIAALAERSFVSVTVLTLPPENVSLAEVVQSKQGERT